MKVILTDFVPNLGDQGDEVNVAAGYARNYLVPKKLAFEATPANIKTYDNNLKQRARKIAKLISDGEDQKTKLESADEFVFTRKSGEEGKLFGSVTSADIEAALSERGYEIEKKKINLSAPIKATGEFEVTVKILKEVAAKIKVVVKAEAIVEEVAEEEVPQGEAAVNAGEESTAVEATNEEGAATEDQEALSAD